MLLRSTLALLFVMSGSFAAAAQPLRESTGELLYSTHCIACHNTEVHWRDKKLAKNWNELRSEVDRWQKLSALGWSNADISAVTRYLNTLHYHYPAPY